MNEMILMTAALDGRQCMIFSSETSNNWHLILSVGISTLYAESYGQIASLVAIDVLMLVIVVIYYIAGSRDRGRLAKVLTANQQFSEGFAVRLQGLASRVRKFGDAHYIGEGGGRGKREPSQVPVPVPDEP